VFVFFFVCVFLLVLLFAIERNNRDPLAPDAACAQPKDSEVQLKDCGLQTKQ